MGKGRTPQRLSELVQAQDISREHAQRLAMHWGRKTRMRDLMHHYGSPVRAYGEMNRTVVASSARALFDYLVDEAAFDELAVRARPGQFFRVYATHLSVERLNGLARFFDERRDYAEVKLKDPELPREAKGDRGIVGVVPYEGNFLAFQYRGPLTLLPGISFGGRTIGNVNVLVDPEASMFVRID